jgi:cGMP-dependent protein kinase
MASGMEKESFLPGDVIIREGNVGDHFFFLTDGQVAVSKANASGVSVRVALLERGAYFGERALLREELRQASCVAETPVTCLSLGRNDFIAMVGSLEDIFDKDKRPVRVMTEEAAAVESIIHRNANAATETTPINNVDSDGFSRDLSLSDFAVGRTLGCGAFGRVKLCRLKGNDEHYALKCQAKSLILSINMQERVLNELEIMRQLDHPFIAKLFGALQDDRHLYFVIELLQGKLK